MRGDFGLKAFEESPKGDRIAQIIDRHALEIEILAKHGVAPVKAVDGPIWAAFGPLANDEKQHVGRMIFKKLGMDKWEVSGRSEFPGAVFTSGSTFRRRTTKPVVIRRKCPRPGGDEHPIKSPTGYQLVRPGLTPDERTRAENAVSVQRLEEALPLLDLGYHIRMGRKGLRPSLIAKDSLIIE
jgi:hypothetical protein